MKRHKDLVKGPSNGDTQVFVLPPDLLEKLGIQLSCIACPTESLAETSIASQSKKDKEDEPHGGNDSSILETANLMKQSVFMSPTFVSTTATETPSELNSITDDTPETKESIQDCNEIFLINNIANTGNTDRIKQPYSSNINPTYLAHQSEDFVEYQSIKEYEVDSKNKNLITTNDSNGLEANTDLINKTSPVDEHADEAYSSDSSNSYSGSCSEITNNDFASSSEKQKPCNKIKIISEQIINNSELNTLKKSRNKKSNSCFLVPVNTIVTTKSNKNRCNKDKYQQKTVQEEQCNTQNMSTKTHNEIGKVVSMDKETMINKEVDGSICVIDRSSIILQNNTQTDLNNKTESVDFTRNICELLLDAKKQTLSNNDDKQIANLKDIGNDEEFTVKINNGNNTKKIVSNTENSSGKSKLCIQGVEKPGGMHEDKINTVLKTYQRTNIQKRIPQFPLVEFTNIGDSNVLLEDATLELDDINMDGYKNKNKFCNCNDFGRLANYDSDVEYEHLHFYDHISVGCTLETLFSMYEDTLILREFNSTENIEVINDFKETTQYNICWSFLSKDNDDNDFDIFESKNRDTSIPNPGQLRRSTRKRKSTATEQVIENVEPKSNKTTKCGVCGLIISDVEWNKHNDLEHNQIAWKDGQILDLKNKSLLKKLGLKLKKIGVLRCTFCKTDIKYLTKFVEHVKTCIKKKVGSYSTSIKNKTTIKDIKKDTTVKLIQPNRRSSRNFNLGVDATESSVDTVQKSKIDSVDKNVHKHTSVENLTETRISKKRPLDSSSKLAERDDNFLESTKSKPTVMPKAVIKSTNHEMSPNKTFGSIDELSKATDNTMVVNKETLKVTRRSVDVSTKAIEVQDTSKAENKDATKSKKAIDVSSKSEMNDTPKPEVKNTVKSKSSPKSEVKSNNVEDITKSDKKSSLHTAKMLIDVAGCPKSTQNAKIDSELIYKSGDTVSSSKSKEKKMIDVSVKSSRKPGDIAKPIISNPTKKLKTLETPTTTRMLKEFDIFSSSASTKIQNNNSDPKQKKKLKNDTSSKTSLTPSKSSMDVSSTSTSKSIEVQVFKRKSIDDEVHSKKTIFAEQKGKKLDISSAIVESSVKINRISVDTHDLSKKYSIIDKLPTENAEVVTSIPIKDTRNVNTSKSETKSPDASLPESLSRESKTTKPQVVYAPSKKEVNRRRMSEIVGTEVILTPKSPRKSVSVITAGITSKCNSQYIGASSSTDTGNVAVHSRNSNTTLSSTSSEGSNNPQQSFFDVSIKEEILPKCGVCKQEVDDAQWIDHIATAHNYLAWRDDESPLDLQDEYAVKAHLYAIAKANGGLKCSNCNVVRKYVKAYLTHIANCNGNEDEQNQMDVSSASVDMDTTRIGSTPRSKRTSQLNVSSISMDVDKTEDLDDVPLKSYSRGAVRNVPRKVGSVVCGVCSETVLENRWIEHIRLEHKYLAWKSGEPPLDVDDEVEVKIFLQNISKYNGGLMCSKCGTVRLYVKKWMDHEARCKGDTNESSSSLIDTTSNDLSESNVADELFEIDILPDIVKCGKCGKEMPKKAWIDHIETEHSYLAWMEGQPPLDEKDTEAVSAYLHAMVKKRGLLYCVKCGVTRKYPKAFLTHISACEISGFKREDFYVAASDKIKEDEYECAVCHEIGNRKNWKNHAMSNHYNVAWMAGDIPINLKNPYAVEKYIKEYRAKYNLVCKECGASRASCYGFYAHILTCGKTEEELEHLMNMCDICNNKYLCIYRNQHMAMHREAALKKERRERDAIKAEEEKNMLKDIVETGEPTGKRRAAEKAKKVMEKYTSNIQDGTHICVSCHTGFDNETRLNDHNCQETQDGSASDSDVSIKMEEREESDDDMEDVDSNISEENLDPLKRKRLPESSSKITLPFKVKDISFYLGKSFENFCELHYTSECLFNNWRRNDYAFLTGEEASIYLPSLTESCKLWFGEEWQTYKRFEAWKKRDNISLFTGATVRCMQWVPQNIIGENQDHFLAIACFKDGDCPRYGKEELPEHPGMLQIWRIGSFMHTAKFELGLAHDYGTIWAMDWCPSGARDIVTPETERGPTRLGLLAIACSNGSAYILSVPQFHTEPEDKPKFCKLNPVAELRLSINPRYPPYRPGYQATSISWSPQKEHEVVMVGYSDGTTALYNLNTASPFLKTIEKDVHIFFPFHDALTESSPITGVAISASKDLRHIIGGVASSSVTGATMSNWPGIAPLVRSNLAASSVIHTPNWPAAFLSSDDILSMKSTNEMNWFGGGRRLGGACAASACARCGRVCLTAPPFVRILRAHPCYPEVKKQIVATMKMIPIAQKRKLKLVNDDLGMIVEPLTYDETVKKYGLEFKTLPKKVQNVASKLCDTAEQCPERFPLSDMPAAAFCPSAEHHNQLAIASHAGFVFIIST